jgi:signal transduction histidine kinase
LHTSLSGFDRKTLRRWLLVLFLALAIPTAVLIQRAYSQLKWEAFHQHQLLAGELAARIDARFTALINAEEAHAFTDYAFLVVAGDPAANFLQRSPLSAYPPDTRLPGLIGYFQVDAQGAFSTPLLPQHAARPADFGISAAELEQRQALAQRIRRILSENRLVQSGTGSGREASLASARQFRDTRHDTLEETDAPSGDNLDTALAQAGSAPPRSRTPGAPAEQEVTAQAAFDRLNTPAAKLEQQKKPAPAGTRGRIEDLKLDKQRYQIAPADELTDQGNTQRSAAPEKRARTERSVLPQLAPNGSVLSFEQTIPTTVPAEAKTSEGNIRIFESEIDPFEFSLLDSGHFVLFRKVWRNGQRYIQGMLLEQTPFLNGVIQTAFTETALSRMSELIVAYQGEVFSAFTGSDAPDYLSSAAQLKGALLYQTHLSAPLSGLEMIFTITRLPPGPGGTLITWIAATLTVALCGGFYLLYRLGAGQIELSRQQQDFISAVSHELKTPLTSIRMYGEMLREGWAPEEKKRTYYDFIFDESERLSRLISNVLQLARMTRNDMQVTVKAVRVAELVDGIRAKVTSQIERAGFVLNLGCDADTGQAHICVDTDAFAQIIINLVDNALKFSAKADTKIIDIACRRLSAGGVQFSVRDYGPGVPRDQMKKIFNLFYRSESELTRETVGTGIGLSLVHQLAQTMQAQVDVVDREPGAEFRVTFPAH